MQSSIILTNKASARNEINGITCHIFEGAFYAYPVVSSFGVPVKKFIDLLEKKEKVQVGNGEGHGGVGITRAQKHGIWSY